MRSPVARLTDIIEAIELIRNEITDLTLDAFESDRRKRWVVERGIEIISEASRHLNGELKARHPQIPWSKVAAIGNVLRHEYERLAYDVLWRVVLNDLPPLEEVSRRELARARATEQSDEGKQAEPELLPVIKHLPAGFDALRQEALAEGHSFVERLTADWEAGRMRFDGHGEVLLATRVSGVLGGIGGLTIDPVLPDALRMRRFYIRPLFRRLGIGGKLAAALLERARGASRLVTVNAAPASIQFWESLGFVPDLRDGHTHRHPLGGCEPLR